MEFSSNSTKSEWLWENMYRFFFPTFLLCCLWVVIPVFGPQWFNFQSWQYPILFVLLIITYLAFCSKKLNRKNAKNIWHYLFQIFKVLIVLPIGFCISISFLFAYMFGSPSYMTSQLVLVSRGFTTPIEYNVYRPVGLFYNIQVGTFTGAVSESEYASYFDGTMRWQNMLYFFVSIVSLVACLYLAYRISLFIYRVFTNNFASNKNISE